MNNNLSDQVKKINSLIKEQTLVKEYLLYRDLFYSSEELKQLNNEIKFLKNCKMNEEDKARYYSLLKKYNENPIVYNFEVLKKEIEELKMEVKNIIKL